MAKIVIEVTCGKETCDDCEFVYGTASGYTPFCRVFSDLSPGINPEEGDLTKFGGTYLRLSECIAAEVRG